LSQLKTLGPATLEAGKAFEPVFAGESYVACPVVLPFALLLAEWPLLHDALQSVVT
jgi:hypothetical protein